MRLIIWLRLMRLIAANFTRDPAETAVVVKLIVRLHPELPTREIHVRVLGRGSKRPKVSPVVGGDRILDLLLDVSQRCPRPRVTKPRAKTETLMQ